MMPGQGRASGEVGVDVILEFDFFSSVTNNDMLQIVAPEELFPWPALGPRCCCQQSSRVCGPYSRF